MAERIIRVARRQHGDQAKGLLLDGGLGVIAGVEEAVEEHRDGVVGDGLNGGLEIGDGDLVGVAVGELGQRGEIGRAHV